MAVAELDACDCQSVCTHVIGIYPLWYISQGGKRVLWVSTSNDLRYDAVRDLADMAAEDIQVYPPVSQKDVGLAVGSAAAARATAGPTPPPPPLLSP